MGVALEESIAIMDKEREKKNDFLKETITGLRAGITGINVKCENAERLPGLLNITSRRLPVSP
ncbi:MAG: hypothetical protein LBS44_00435 [Deltaproteobacteria bacterium]|nr:hypothetical protein [Deltaproteobacteria bacterium]